MNQVNPKREPRQLDGVLLVDKGPNLTSFQVVKKIKKLFNVSKVGHTGTLDPIATGLLAICLGRATKLASIIMPYRKEYDVWAKFGVATDSHDRTGMVIDEKPWQHITEAQTLEALKSFIGEIPQIAPMFSAVKHQGRPLYWYAHQGISLATRKERTCTIFSIDLLEWQPPRARFLVKSSHGTYVRTLIHDLGIKLGSVAMVDELRRTGSGEFRVENAYTFEALTAMSEEERLAKVMSMNAALPEMPDFRVNAALVERIKTGRTIMWSDVRAASLHSTVQETEPKMFKLTGPQGDLVAIASLADNLYAGQLPGASLISNRVVQTLRVFANS